jgi:uncharacterized Zn-binding protein involved in type VI secretion
MSKSIIVLGDKTSHGGAVISASPFSDTHGKGWARVGDMVTCPRCGGVFPIIEGESSHTDEGRAVAYAGCAVKCGAKLLPSQMFTTTEASASAAAPAVAAAVTGTSALGAVAENQAAGYEEQLLDDERTRYRGRFRIVDDKTGQPIAGQRVRVGVAGEEAAGSTDADGYTDWVERDASQALVLELEPTTQP